MIAAAIILGLLAVGVSISVVVSEGGLSTILSRNWPIADGRIEDGEVFSVGPPGRTMFRARLTYSFRINGQYYRGSCSQDFYQKGDASEFVESRKGGAAQIKYSPRKPHFSILL